MNIFVPCTLLNKSQSFPLSRFLGIKMICVVALSIIAVSCPKKSGLQSTISTLDKAFLSVAKM